MKIMDIYKALEEINANINVAHNHPSDECFIVGEVQQNLTEWRRAKIKSVTEAGKYECGCPKGVILNVE